MNHRIDQRTEELKGAENGNRGKLSLGFTSFLFLYYPLPLTKARRRANAGAGHLGARGIKASSGIGNALLLLPNLRRTRPCLCILGLGKPVMDQCQQQFQSPQNGPCRFGLAAWFSQCANTRSHLRLLLLWLGALLAHLWLGPYIHTRPLRRRLASYPRIARLPLPV